MLSWVTLRLAIASSLMETQAARRASSRWWRIHWAKQGIKRHGIAPGGMNSCHPPSRKDTKMISLLSNLGRKSLALPAVLIVWLLPVTVWAETITIKNTTAGPVLVQPACLVRGQVVPARPIPLKAGDTSPGIVLPGNKIIVIRDTQNRVVAQIPIPSGTDDLEVVMGTAPNGKPVWTINKVMPPPPPPPPAKCP
jgi:hypothetical protein